MGMCLGLEVCGYVSRTGGIGVGMCLGLEVLVWVCV